MAYVYFLKSDGSNWVYVGSTTDLQKRIAQHNAGNVISTKSRKPFHLIYHEEFDTIHAARQREREIKARRLVKEKIIRNLH